MEEEDTIGERNAFDVFVDEGNDLQLCQLTFL